MAAGRRRRGTRGVGQEASGAGKGRGKGRAASSAAVAQGVAEAPGSARRLEGEILEAIGSLYDDRLRPYGRILRKRLEERREAAAARRGGGRAAAVGEVYAEAFTSQRLRARCEAMAGVLEVRAEEGGEWSALLLERRSDTFVDIYSEEDPYPDELWQEAAAYFAELAARGDASFAAAGGAALPGGRYASARELLGRAPAWLAGRSLGEVCHIMELAIAQHQLLGYLHGAIVPFVLSSSMAKQRCAQARQPAAAADAATADGGSGGGYPVVGWEDARDRLRLILEDAVAEGQRQVPLSNVKRLFRSRFRLELSETALGHAKISNLLQDAFFEDLCHVHLQDRGYAVVPGPRPATLPGTGASLRRGRPPSSAEAPGADATPASRGSAAASSLPLRGASSRSFRSLLSPSEGDLEQATPSSERWAALSSEGSTVDIRATFIHAAVPPSTPSGANACRLRSMSVPKDHGSDQRDPDYVPPAPPPPQAPPFAEDASTDRPSPVARVKPVALDDDLFEGFAPFAAQEAVAPRSPAPSQRQKEGQEPAFCTFDLEPATSCLVPHTPSWMDDDAGLGALQHAEFPMRTPSPQWGASSTRCLLGRASPKGSPKHLAGPQKLSLDAMIEREVNA